MAVPCVRVAREQGEQARRALVERDLLDHEHAITSGEGYLYVPVTDIEAVPDEYDVVDRNAPARETQCMPADVLGFDPSYERLGDIVVLDEDDHERARRIADAVLDSDLPAKTVVNRASKVRGELRVRDWDVLAGDGTETIHREYGCAYRLDIAAVYFSPRLATDRHLVAEQVHEGERAIDMFAGVGPFVVPFAKRGARVVGIDLNPVAIEYLRENARHNGVDGRVSTICGDVREVVLDYQDWADRLVMNLPHSAAAFLDTALLLASEECVLHYYDIQSEDDPYGPGERAIRAAASEAGYEAAVETRRTVRSYAPHELNVRLDVRLRRR